MTTPYYWSKKNEHEAALLWASIRDRRGLNVVIGKPGSGKSALCRELVRKYAGGDSGMHPMFLPSGQFHCRKDLISVLDGLFHKQLMSPEATERAIMDRLRRTLKTRSMEHPAPTVLFIDDVNRLHNDVWSVIHELLLDELDGQKTIQIVLLMRPEHFKAIHEHPNVMSRIETSAHVSPLSFSETHCFAIAQLKYLAPHRTRHISILVKFLFYAWTWGNPEAIRGVCASLVTSPSENPQKPMVLRLLQHLVLRETSGL
ncbi:ATP-binding protein [Desulfovibrio inopinatus]|uniref:ATP-binding protein n=1 Tax=Desulfovibrio inopinatus TaxID=102109 RepID=UPI000408EAD7|nr:ATP-binding protein [Desulfovibrio inopinatus]